MIDMNKQYQTVGGDEDEGEYPEPVRIICVDGPGKRPIVGFIGENTNPFQWRIDGKFRHDGQESVYDLVEVSPYADFKIDDPVIVNNAGRFCKSHFAGIDKNGNPMVWPFGSTSWSREGDPISVYSLRRPTEDEMK